MHELDTMSILRGLMSASEHLDPNSKGGAHTEVFKFDKTRLEQMLEEWIRIGGKDPSGRRGEIERFAEDLSSRYLLKRGNIKHFVMKLGGKEESVIDRGDLSDIFGSVGYNLLPSFDKTVQDATEASREFPYFSYGSPSSQFAPSIPDVVQAFVSGRIHSLPNGDEAGVFLVHTVEARRDLTVYEILQEDPYFKNAPSDFKELVILQANIRKNPIDRAVEERLRNFFSSPITVGVRDTIRWFIGSRHPAISWEDAREIILDCFEKHGEENFLVPEMNFYAPSTHHSKEELQDIAQINAQVTITFTKHVNRKLPLAVSGKIGHRLLECISEQVLRYHHDYPIYDIDPVSGYINRTTAKLLSRLAMGWVFHMMKITFPNRTNIDVATALYRRGLLESLRTVLSEKELEITLKTIQESLFTYMIHGGMVLPDKNRRMFRQTLNTFYSFQWRADHVYPDEKLLHKVSLEDLAKPEHVYLFREFPDLSEKLIVFFVLVLRFYLDTDFIPDLRPDEAGVNIFILGIWGAITENVIILITEDENGEERIRIQFIDNKDHFKAYRREVDREQPLGLAKHALRIVGPVVEPAMLRAIGSFVQTTWENRTGLVRPKKDLAETIERLMSIIGEVVLQSMDETQSHVRTILEDSLDDTSRAVSTLVRKLLRKGHRPEPKGPPIQKSAMKWEPEIKIPKG